MESLYFPIIKQNDVFVAGGKIEVLDPVSTNFIDVYVYNATNDSYTIVNNPIYVNGEGRSEQTYFVKQLAYLRLYKYLGEFSDPRTDDESANWQFIRDWYNSIDLETGSGENLDVSGLYGLQDADTSLGTVDVVGYWTTDDCEKRTYIWDETCTAQPDAGYVVQSNSTEVGRWILLFDGEYLPSTYYGVYPGHQENMNALLTYPSVVGSNELRTAPGVYFVKGNYTASTVTLVTEKKLLIDADTYFSNEQIQCNHVSVVGSSTHAIGDFYVVDSSCTVHSGWFKHPENFLTCGSKDLYIDANHYFETNTLNYPVTITNAIIHGTNRLPISYGTNGRITINNCVILGNNIFNSSDLITFQHMEFRDDWFTSPQNVDFYTKVFVRTMSMNRLMLSNFQSEVAYVNAMGANGETRIDLAGRRIANFVCPVSVVEIYNVVCTGQMGITKTGTVNVVLNNVKCNDVVCTCQQLTVENGSNVRFGSEPSVLSFVGNNSTITGGSFFTSHNQYIFTKCTVNVSFKRATDNTTDESILQFEDCIISQNCIIEAKHLIMRDCTTNNNTIKIYPFKDSSNVYHLNVHLEGNIFDNISPIEFTKFDMINGSYDEDCYDCVLNWKIVNNTFNDNQGGLKCRYWQNRVGAYYTRTFVKWGSNIHTIKYYGNTGSCPRENAYGVTMNSDTGCEQYFTYITVEGDSTVTLSRQTSDRVMLNFDNTTYHHWNSKTIGGNGLPVKTKYTGNDGGDFDMVLNCWVYPWSDVHDNIDNGDLFKVGFSKWGKITEDGVRYWIWRFLAVPGDFSAYEQID